MPDPNTTDPRPNDPESDVLPHPGTPGQARQASRQEELLALALSRRRYALFEPQ